MRWFWKIKKFKHHKNVSNHILFYVFIISQHFTGGHSIIKIKYFWDFVILHFYRIFNRIDQSESTAKILDLVQVDHWTDHKTNIVAASFHGLLKKTGQNISKFFDGLGQGSADGSGGSKGQRNTTWLKESIFERKFRKSIPKPTFVKCNLPYKPFKSP